jgi:hypothetical protein
MNFLLINLKKRKTSESDYIHGWINGITVLFF